MIYYICYIEETIKKFKDNIDTGIEIKGRKIAMLRFANDIALLRGNKNELGMLWTKQTIFVKGIKMKINRSKTNVLVCKKKEQMRQECIKISRDHLKEVKEFCYVGSEISWDGTSQKEIKYRITQAKRSLI